MFDLCNSIFKRANYIFITSFHYNDPYIQKFIKEKSDFFHPATIVHLEMCAPKDEQKLVELLGGPSDGHAGNTEISNMMIIDASTTTAPSKNDKKSFIEDPFETDNIAERSANGIADNHPDWIVNKEVGQKSLDLYTERMIHNLREYVK
jgi:hypothetical protein